MLLPVSFLLVYYEIDLLSVRASSDHGDALPHDQLDSDEKTLQWILQSGKNVGLDEVVVDLPSSSNAVEITQVDDVLNEGHGCMAPESNVSQSSLLDDQSAHSHLIHLHTDSPANEYSHYPSSLDLKSVEPVVSQPRRGVTMTRIGRTDKPPKRLICEMNDQIMEDSSRSSPSSVVTCFCSVA